MPEKLPDTQTTPTRARPHRRKIVMIGLDAADLRFMQSSLQSLPTLRRFLQGKMIHSLQSTADLMAGSVWPTFYTGTLPADHGIYHHLQWDPHSMCLRRVAADWLYCEPFWYTLEQRGLQVVAVDVPMTFPPRLTQGIEVINWGSHDQLSPFAAHPKWLEQTIRQRFGSQHPMGAEIPVNKTPAELERIRANLVAGAQRKGELTRWLLENFPWDFFITVFGECHRGGHILWPEGSAPQSMVSPTALLEVYQAVDQALGQVLEAICWEDTTVILFALHGMGPNTSQEHLVPKIMDRVNAHFSGTTQTLAASQPAKGGQRSVFRLLRERLPARLQNVVAQAVPVRLRDAVVNRAVTGGYVWQQTPGLALLADLHGYLRFNLQQREQHGMLASDSADFVAYKDLLYTGFHSFRIAESGAPLVKDVCFVSQEFSGHRSHYLPDVIVTWTGAPPASHIQSDTLGPLTAELATGRGGNHCPEGFYIILNGSSGYEGGPFPTHIKDLATLVLRQLTWPAEQTPA